MFVCVHVVFVIVIVLVCANVRRRDILLPVFVDVDVVVDFLLSSFQ